jgi:hypothetical protein
MFLLKNKIPKKNNNCIFFTLGEANVKLTFILQRKNE